MEKLSLDLIKDFRANTFRFAADQRLKTIEEAIEFVNQRGFVFFWPIKGIRFASLWTAVAGDRLVPNEHDDPGHITWGWKDELLDQKVWYYAKFLRKKSTMISLDLASRFYALSDNFGSPEEDYLSEYRQGKMTHEAKLIFEAILRLGPQDSIILKEITHLNGSASANRFNRALIELQTGMKILPVGISRAGGWNYAFIFDAVHQHYPQIVEDAREITATQARCELMESLFLTLGAARIADIKKLFQWSEKSIQVTLDSMVKRGYITPNVVLGGSEDVWFVLNEIS